MTFQCQSDGATAQEVVLPIVRPQPPPGTKLIRGLG